MDAAKSMKLLKEVERSGTRLICTCCGAETLSTGDMGICSNCESLIHADRKSLLSTNPELVGNLDAIRKGIATNDFGTVASTYERMKRVNEGPSLLYAKALACIAHSNYEISRISYDRKGFMEENALHRDRGSELASKAKLLITKAMQLATHDIKEGSASIGVAYTLFLLQVKLGAMKGASHTLHELGRIGSAAYVPEYASIVFSASMKDYDDVIKHADVMAASNQLPLNLFYYVALALFKKGKVADSVRLLKELQRLMANSNIGTLLDEIKKAQEV